MAEKNLGPGTLYIRKSMFPADGDVKIIIREGATIYENISMPERYQSVVVDGKRYPYDPRRGWSYYAPPQQWRRTGDPTARWQPAICAEGIHAWSYTDDRVGAVRRCAACGAIEGRDPDAWPPAAAPEDDEDEAPPGG